MDLLELGAFLKSRRARIRPAEAGLTAGPRRRVPGLRRDEVAHLAGASVDYYTELERGRGAQPSPRMLAALARALRLDNDEREQLFRLAGRAAPAPHSPVAHVQPALLGLLDRLESTPAQVVTELHVTLVQNRLAAALIGRPPAERGPAASALYRWFTDPRARTLHPPDDHADHSRALVADLRAVVARRGPETEASEMVTKLRRHSTEFVALWDAPGPPPRRAARKRIVHAALGVIEVDCLTLLSEDGRQRLLWYAAPPGSPAVDQLELLSVIGAQELATPAQAD